MLKLRPKKIRANYIIEVTDIDGNKKRFNTAKEVAEALDVKVQTIRGALCYNLKVRGCKLAKVFS